MKLEKIITLGNKNVELQFKTMESSLRATGCDLPVLVIPYNDDRFQLPPNANWLDNIDLFNWLKSNNAWNACRKYACFVESNYLYVDADVYFLRNPSDVLAPVDGFITSCTHWNNPEHTTTQESESTLRKRSTTWQKGCFNSGQWACSERLFNNINALIQFVESRCEIRTLLTETQAYKDQPAINLLVNLCDIPISNLTLPPYNMQSTWAGDYKESGYAERYWKDKDSKPMLIHWAGCSFSDPNIAINELLKKYLRDSQIATARTKKDISFNSRLRFAVKAFLKEFNKRKR